MRHDTTLSPRAAAGRALLLPLAATLALAAPLSAQGAATSARPPAAAPPPALPAAPPRPKLDRQADTNDWGAYYDRGVEMLNHQRPDLADGAFWWATQINPERAEPIFAQWVSFWMHDSRMWERYLKHDKYVLRRPDVIAADSLPGRAIDRNPFVHRGLVVLIYNQMPGYWASDNLTRGWLNYAQGRFDRAVVDLGKALGTKPEARDWIRTMRAQAFLSLRQYDSTAAELRAMQAELALRDELTLGSGYASKETLHYALGLLAAARGQVKEAKAEMGAALTENLAFAPAHDLLAQVALAEGDTAAALPESEQAAQLAPDDAVFQYRYGLTLLLARRAADAVAPLRRATVLRPWYAKPYYDLGVALDQTGDKAGARAALARFAELAPRSDAERAAAARAY